MEQVKGTFTVCFEDPFWIGVYERTDGNTYEVCKITFGAEPKDYEVYDFLLRKWAYFTFAKVKDKTPPSAKKINPKRLKRAIRRAVNMQGVGTKAQQVLKQAYVEQKLQREKQEKIQKHLLSEQRYQLRQKKKKKKQKGH